MPAAGPARAGRRRARRRAHAADGACFRPARQPEAGSRAHGRRQSARRGRIGLGRGRTDQAGERAGRPHRGHPQAAHGHRQPQQGGPRAPARRLRQGDAHFRELFVVLFGGGAAELQLVEFDDPLEAGLEILAKPPGKKPATMTLLSGGEQALTAMSLIFAVFLTNPSPICVLDEVDAPLDDANVERFCDLLDDMRRKTDTRFVTITHNPITMARMDRLFGVTQAERGVSQLVSVELEQAETAAGGGLTIRSPARCADPESTTSRRPPRRTSRRPMRSRRSRRCPTHRAQSKSCP